MQHHQRIASVFAAALVWLAPTSAAPMDLEDERVEAGRAAATWVLIDARNHVHGTNGLVAVVFGVAQERGRSRPASLRVDCFDGVTTVHVDTAGLGTGSPAMAVRHSLDGGRYLSASWHASVEGSGLELSADRAIAFLIELYGRNELRLAVVRPLSVPFLIRFAIGGTEHSLRTLADRCHWSAGPSVSGL